MSTIYIYLIKGTNVRKNVLIFFLFGRKRGEQYLRGSSHLYDTSQFIPVRTIA